MKELAAAECVVKSWLLMIAADRVGYGYVCFKESVAAECTVKNWLHSIVAERIGYTRL